MRFYGAGGGDGRQYWAVEGLADRQMAVPLHAHSREEEVWYVLEGEIRFFFGDEVRVGGPGTFVHILRGCRTRSRWRRSGRAGSGSDAGGAR
ncbi:MAG: cupin domain-containing protein [Thermomicrobiales bacterium]